MLTPQVVSGIEQDLEGWENPSLKGGIFYVDLDKNGNQITNFGFGINLKANITVSSATGQYSLPAWLTTDMAQAGISLTQDELKSISNGTFSQNNAAAITGALTTSSQTQLSAAQQATVDYLNNKTIPGLVATINGDSDFGAGAFENMPASVQTALALMYYQAGDAAFYSDPSNPNAVSQLFNYISSNNTVSAALEIANNTGIPPDPSMWEKGSELII